MFFFYTKIPRSSLLPSFFQQKLNKSKMSERFLPYQLHTQQSVKYYNKEGIEDTNNNIAIKTEQNK